MSVTSLPLPPQAMKVLSKKKLLKQYGFPRAYLSGPVHGSSWPGDEGDTSEASFVRTRGWTGRE